MTPPAPAQPDEPGVVEDFVDIFASPAKVFLRRAKTGGGMAFLVVTAVLIALLYSGRNVMEPIIEAQTTRSMTAAQAKNPQITPEVIQSAVGMQKKFMTVGFVIGTPITIVGVALLVWVVGKVFGAAVTFGSSVMIASFACIPRIIGAIATDVQGLMTSDLSTLTNMSQVSLSPARFMDPATANASVLALLMRLDVTTIWATALIAIAYASAGKLPKGKAWTAAIVIWVLGSLVPLWGALRAG